MRVRLVKVGRSRGIRIPKAIIDELRLEGPLELEIRRGRLVLSKARRAGWGAAAAEMARRGDDRLVHGDQVASSSWDAREWEW